MTSMNSQNQKKSGTCVVRLSQPDVSSTETVLEDYQRKVRRTSQIGEQEKVQAGLFGCRLEAVLNLSNLACCGWTKSSDR